MLPDQAQQLRVDGRPDAAPRRLAARDGVEVHERVRLDHGLHGDVDAQVERLAHARVDDGALALRAGEEARHLVERPLRRREADALHVAPGLLGEALERDGEVGAPLGLGHRVDLVDDDPLRAGEEVARLRGEHEVQRLRRGDEDVRRVLEHLAALALRRVAGAHGDAHVGADAAQRGAQVALDVVPEGLERRDVDQPHAPLPRVGRRRLGDEAVERPQERGKRLAGTGGRRDQRVLPRRDGRPGLRLGRRGLLERTREPVTDLRRERRERGMCGWHRHVQCGCPWAAQASHTDGDGRDAASRSPLDGRLRLRRGRRGGGPAAARRAGPARRGRGARSRRSGSRPARRP